MEKKIFVLGLPGSGKSTVARYIEMLARDYDWCPNRLNDYDILYEWFNADKEGRVFSATEYGGFDVHDHNVFDEALKEVERRVVEEEKVPYEKNKLIIIEFARDDYRKALELFLPSFLRNASFLFIDADIPSCIQRIKERAAHPCTLDDHYVSNYIFETYYQRDNRQYLASTTAKLKNCCRIDEERILVVDNTGTSTMQSFFEKIKPLVTSILKANGPGIDPESITVATDELTATHYYRYEDASLRNIWHS